eukprot:c6735_g1_i1.p1 GENE.c6735_g1_i1~~c6735_g1_i1.p1  ORF type:complete len:463 (+),score=95.91 c6735_g1_i1:15-1403(+)
MYVCGRVVSVLCRQFTFGLQDQLHQPASSVIIRYASKKPKGKPLQPRKPTFVAQINFALPELFESGFKRFEDYKKKYLSVVIPTEFAQDPELAKWSQFCRKRFSTSLSNWQRELLMRADFPLQIDQDELIWMENIHQLNSFIATHGHLDLASHPSLRTKKSFVTWFQMLPKLFDLFLLPIKRVDQLAQIGFDLFASSLTHHTNRENYVIQSEALCKLNPEQREVKQFEIMLAQLHKWIDTYRTSHVPRSVFDNTLLGEFVAHMRHLKKVKKIPKWQQDRLDELNFMWKVPKSVENVYMNAHLARKYFVEHGEPVPVPYLHTDPELIRVSAHMARQIELLKKGKLGPAKLKLFQAGGGLILIQNDRKALKLWREAITVSDKIGKKTATADEMKQLQVFAKIAKQKHELQQEAKEERKKPVLIPMKSSLARVPRGENPNLQQRKIKIQVKNVKKQPQHNPKATI